MSYERLGRIENDLTMVKPRPAGADTKGNPFVITADSAVQDAHNPKKASLKNMEADLSVDRGNWINARARTGMVDMNTGALELRGGIAVFTATGYELHTNSACANLKQSMIHGHEPVTGQGPQGTLRADEFHADRATEFAHFERSCPDDAVGNEEMKHALIVLAALLAALAVPASFRQRRAAQADCRQTAMRRSTFRRTVSRRISTARLGTWSGNVIVTQGDMKLRANTVRMTTVNGKADKVYGQRQCGGGFAQVRHRHRREWRLFGGAAHRGDDGQCRAEKRQGRDARRAVDGQSRHRPGGAGRRRQRPDQRQHARASRIHAQFPMRVRATFMVP